MGEGEEEKEGDKKMGWLKERRRRWVTRRLN